MGSFACQHVPSCLSNQLFVHDPSGGLSRQTSRDATPTPQIPAHISCYNLCIHAHISCYNLCIPAHISCYNLCIPAHILCDIYAYMHIFYVIFMHTCTYFMLYLCIPAHIICYIYVYVHIFYVVFMYTCTYFMPYLCIPGTCTYFMLYLCIPAHVSCFIYLPAHTDDISTSRPPPLRYSYHIIMSHSTAHSY